MTSVALAGSTGLIGSNILSVLQKLPSVDTINAFARKELSPDEKVKPIGSTDSGAWPGLFPAGSQLYISALGTTRANAGGFDNQKKIDYDLNLELARAAKDAGTNVYVLISSAGSDPKSPMGYPKMKGELEEAVKALNFDHTVIVRPGVIVGDRNESRLVEGIFQSVAKFAGRFSNNKLKDFWAQDADVIAKAAVRAGLDAVEGQDSEKVRILTQADILRIGRVEWKK
ncbi:NAD dependent epimerase/dehydratase family protein-like protein [Teratosphaeria destructans]|uniref:NAD dependent epimerase/dehydratase family protein-like protein n=1 Tax=Teratosphaeria destructans TaxID=418781 RepID=A0A9W7SKW4_9PEZI|nr:NAD dependent epimerase/dehydratase family protein-like protein [Teratosphaeria destructans]